MKTICDICEFYPCTDDRKKPMRIKCPGYSPIPKPQTKGDRIRAMSDEELVDEYFYILHKVFPRYTESRLGLMHYLKQEADKEEQP